MHMNFMMEKIIKCNESNFLIEPPITVGRGKSMTCLLFFIGRYIEYVWWDPKGCELSLLRMKPEETLVEVRRRPDVQIGAQK